jgi:tellurite methyltransferase
MTYNYDKLYGTTPDALGAPTQVFVDFFRGLSATNLRVLDVGCGQGRDAVFIARLGHTVVGIDCAPNGIRDLNAVAEKEKLKITGVVVDIENFEPEGMFDVVLIDRTLHMLATKPRLRALAALTKLVRRNGYLLIADEAKNILEFTHLLDTSSDNWETLRNNRGYLFVRRR